MSELADESETEVLQANLKNPSDLLKSFNDSFSSWHYVMNMDALTMDWPQRQMPELVAIQSRPTAYADIDKTMTETIEHDAANTTTATALSGASGKSGVKMEKKERNILVEKTISCLPLEFRGSDPVNHFLYLHIFLILSFAELKCTYPVLDLIAPPDLNRARVNKCLIALINRKIVQKDNSTGTVLYRWQGTP
ncbi:hypothetical protein PILCRDRAFT_13823 [Piloderma croceum F 1598]|uniref:Uncharacterized protein n=1 Tax=Piloderma croceum (strain F 1598) TaxID=765440 RepID=A0A0C3ERF2_PILCF|nr:hypothetical protein PILCRDRAFT_13823 [Piloderma croceum F 1598]